ncbi:hypothetical protein QW131_06305 [Roseibium salinum]|nr:hypothetical protein [Roseibium salinum]
MMFYRGARLASGLTAAVSLFALQLSPALAFEPSGNDVADAFLTILDSDQGTVESYGGCGGIRRRGNDQGPAHHQ